VRARLRPILVRRGKRQAFINFDMEQYAYKDLTLQIFRIILEEERIPRLADVGIALRLT